MRHICVLAVLLATASASGSTPAEVVPVDRVEGHRTGTVTQRPDWVDRSGEPGPVWTVLEALTPEERANAVIRFDLGPGSPAAWAEAAAIEDLWNSGQYESAIERLHGIGNFHDPQDIDVGMSWREPIPTIIGTDWEDNVRVGNRDSVYEIELDRNNRTGNLFLASVRDGGTYSYVNVYMSTDAGNSWSETYNAAVAQSYINSIGAVSNGSHFYVGYTRNPNLTLGRVMRFDADSGNQVRFPNDSLFRTMFQADANDSIQEIAMISADDEFPATRMYAMGCTEDRKLEFAYTDSLANSWPEVATNVGWCDGGLSFVYNPHYDTGDRFIWASWIYERTDTLWNVGVWYHDTLPYGFYINPAFEKTYTNTSIAAWKDTILIAYVRDMGTRRYLSSFFTRNAGYNWIWHHLPDTLTAREHPNVTGRHGAGFALAARQYSNGRDLSYSHSSYIGSTWTPFLDISDYQPALADPRLVFIPRGRYGCAYIKWYQAPDGYSIWFNRSDWTGVEDVMSLYPKFGLAAGIVRDKAELRFQNPRRGPVSVRVYDAAGRLVSRETRVLGAGEQVFEVKARSSGVHFAVIDIDGETVTTRLTFAR
jgi:hypothetical protein